MSTLDLRLIALLVTRRFINNVVTMQVKLEVDVKAGNNPKVIAIDEAKAIGAYHVVLDK